MRVAAGVLPVLAAMALPAVAGAATIAPNSINDDFTNNGTCSLREAVSLASADLTSFQGCTVSADEDADTIELTPGQTYTMSLPGVENANATGDLDILNEPLTIESTGPSRATIFANGAVTGDRVIDVDDQASPVGVTASLTDVDITGGDDTAGAGGGAIRVNYGLLNVTRSRISANNSAAGGGAVLRLDGSAALLDTVITGNTGGGMAIFQEFGNLSLVRSAITGHVATDVFTGGAAIAKQSITSGTLTIQNSTLSGNSAKAGGGALWVLGGGATTILNSTIANNTADSDAGGPAAGNGGGILVTGGVVNVANSIVADNVDGSPATDHDDCSGTVSSAGRNLIESTSGCSGLDLSDIVNQDPALNPLSGGDTPTHSYAAGAPADNAGNPAPVGGGYPFCPTDDQRGFPRDNSISSCDIGAYERQPPVLNPIGDKSVQLGSTLAFSATATDSDVGDVITFASPDLPAGATLSPAGAFSWTPSAAQVGSFPGVTINALDGSLADGEDITITVTTPGSTTAPGGTNVTPTKKCKKGRKLKKGKCVKKKRKKRTT